MAIAWRWPPSIFRTIKLVTDGVDIMEYDGIVWDCDEKTPNTPEHINHICDQGIQALQLILHRLKLISMSERKCLHPTLHV